MTAKGPLPSVHEAAAKKLRTFFSSKKDVTAEQFKKVTCFGDLHEHTGITAEDAKTAMEAADGKAKDKVEEGEEREDDEEKSVMKRCWTKVATKTTVRGDDPFIETLTKYESPLLFFEATVDLPEKIVAELDEMFMKIEAAKNDAAVEPQRKKQRKEEVPKPADKVAPKKSTDKKKAKDKKKEGTEKNKDEAEKKKEGAEELKAKLAKLQEETKALQEQMAAAAQ